jgi:hypothetical protein
LPAPGVPKVVQEIAVAAGFPKPYVKAQTRAGQNLEYHITTCSTAGTSGIIFTGIGAGSNWNFVVMQPRNIEAAAVGGYTSQGLRTNFVSLWNLVRARSSNVAPVIYEPWAWAWGHPQYPSASPDPPTMQSDTLANCQLAEFDMNTNAGFTIARIALAGEGFRANNWNSNIYRADDLFHANLRGYLLAAMKIYQSIYNAAISDIPVPSPGVSNVLRNIWLTNSFGQPNYEEWNEMAKYAMPEPGIFEICNGIFFIWYFRRQFLSFATDNKC